MATTVSCSISPAVPGKRCVLPTRIVLALNSSGTGSEVITFSPEFDNAPPPLSVMLVKPLGANGTIDCGTPTKSGMTVTLTTATNITGGVAANCEVVIGVHEPL